MPTLPLHWRHGVWVPAFAGTTPEFEFSKLYALAREGIAPGAGTPFALSTSPS